MILEKWKRMLKKESILREERRMLEGRKEKVEGRIFISMEGKDEGSEDDTGKHFRKENT